MFAGCLSCCSSLPWLVLSRLVLQRRYNLSSTNTRLTFRTSLPRCVQVFTSRALVEHSCCIFGMFVWTGLVTQWPRRPHDGFNSLLAVQRAQSEATSRPATYLVLLISVHLLNWRMFIIRQLPRKTGGRIASHEAFSVQVCCVQGKEPSRRPLARSQEVGFVGGVSHVQCDSSRVWGKRRWISQGIVHLQSVLSNTYCSKEWPRTR